MKGTERYTTAWALPVLVLASFVVHGLTFAYSAFSDDHSALWNAGVQGIPWRNGFFRPLSDLTFRIGFLLHGSDAGSTAHSTWYCTASTGTCYSA